jgi:two-component system sensor histidine kinase CpxA
LRFPRLFVKVFLWFWATVVLTGISVVLAFLFQAQSGQSHWRQSLPDTARYFGTSTALAFEQGGASPASRYLDELSRDELVHACLFDTTANPLAGKNCSVFTAMAARVAKGEVPHDTSEHGWSGVAVIVHGTGGQSYIYASELLPGPRATWGPDLKGAVLRIAMALFVSGLVCYLLTRYLITPTLRLRSAAQQIAEGRFDIRAEASLESRRDEFGDLVRDFNRMAARIENLISSQRQLLNDVSHELRSPLARMNVALDLLRRHAGEHPALRRMEIDLQRLNALIGRLLTIARLEAASTLQNPVLVNLSELVSNIAADVEFELQERGCRVDIVQAADLTVLGDPGLLRSAIENVLRNAVRFTGQDTAVEVYLRAGFSSPTGEALIVIRDHGPGVPEDELLNIFRPFYRAADPRGLESSGAGLGLAIAERIVALHRGKIRAMNEASGGLCVEMTFLRESDRTA